MRSIAKFILNAIPRPWLIKLSILLRPFIYILFKGSRFTDPIDERSYRKFLPYGYGKQRLNALSPGTLSLERHRQMWLYLENETDFFHSIYKVLHVAPEQAFINRFKKLKNLDYLTTDLFSPIVDVKADITNLPFENETFDIVFCNHVLEHIVDDQQAMRELYRVLRKGGWGILQVPIKMNSEKTYEDFSITDKNERRKHFGQYDHVRWYGRDYFDRLERAGFSVKALYYSHHFSVEQRKKYGLLDNEILPLVFKN